MFGNEINNLVTFEVHRKIHFCYIIHYGTQLMPSFGFLSKYLWHWKVSFQNNVICHKNCDSKLSPPFVNSCRHVPVCKGKNGIGSAPATTRSIRVILIGRVRLLLYKQ